MNHLFMKKDIKKLLILYGTQTGTTEKFAKTLFNSARARRFPTSISIMDEYDFASQLNKEIHVLFLLSTFYNGEFTDNASKLWRFLNSRNIPRDYLSMMNYSVFGLGNSSFKVKLNKINKIV